MLSLFLTHLEGYKKDAVKSPILIILEVICELLLPLVMAEIVDVAIPSGDTGYIFTLGAAMLLLAAISMACGVLAAKYAAFASQGFGGNLRQCLFDKVQEFSFADIDRFSSASLITRMTNDVNAMTMMLAMGLRMLVRAPVMLIAALGVSLYLNARLAIVLLVIIPLMVLAIAVLMKVCTKLFEQMQKKIDGLNNVLQENLVAIRVVKAFVREDHEREKFNRSSDELMDAGLTVGMRVIAMMPIMMLCMNGATLAILYFGGKMVMGATFELGDLNAFLSYIMQVLMSVMMVAMSLLQLSRAQACARRINEVLDAVPSVQNKEETAPLPAPRGKVEFQDVSFKYAAGGTGDDVLSRISFSVEPGQFVAIVGGTGTGKSSLVNLIPRFYDATGGSVLVDGVDVRDYPLEELRSRIGMVLQDTWLFSGTIRENIRYGRLDATDQEVEEAARAARADKFIRALPQGYDTQLGEDAANISQGQRQLLTIARAILSDPDILILDEATSSVDTRTEVLIQKAMNTLMKGRTSFVIAHRLSTIRDAGKILVMRDGDIIEAGNHQELMAKGGFYAQLYQSQFKGEDEASA